MFLLLLRIISFNDENNGNNTHVNPLSSGFFQISRCFSLSLSVEVYQLQVQPEPKQLLTLVYPYKLATRESKRENDDDGAWMTLWIYLI